MKYEVIQNFNDAQDNGHAYHEGDIYPRDGIAPSDSRILELMSSNNFMKVSLIQPYVEKADEPKEELVPEKEADSEKVVWTEEDINKMPFLKLKAVAKQNGIDVEDKKAAELKAELIEKLVEVE